MSSINNRDALAAMILEARTERKLSQRKVAELAGMHPTSFQRIEWGESDLLSPHAVALSKVLDIPILVLLQLASPNSPNTLLTFVETKVPVLDYADAAKLAAGLVTLDEVKPIDKAPYFGVDGKMLFALRISDDSMGSRFKEGDTIIIDWDKRKTIKPGAYVAACWNQTNIIIREYRETRSGFELHPLNTVHKKLSSPDDDLIILGPAIQLIQKL